jgi:hypothetical protein
MSPTGHSRRPRLGNLLFTILVPGSGAILVPRWILQRFESTASATAWPAAAVIALGFALYLS